MTPLIAVVGATGAQGGGLVRAALSDPARRFKVRAITRDPQADKAKALAKLGAEVVAANLDDTPSLTAAFSGADGAFCVTNYWEHFSPAREISQVHSLAHACHQAGVKHVIWSTLEDTRERVPLADPRMPTLQGQYKVPHFDTKGGSEHFFREGNVPTTFLRTSYYWDNLIHFGMGPRRAPDGTLHFVLPMADKPLPGLAAEDIGKCAYGIFRRGPELIGKTVGIAGEHLTGEQMAAALTQALGQKVSYDYVPPEIYATFPFSGADDIANMFQYKRDFNAEYCAIRDVAFSRALNPELQTFADWLERHKREIPIPA